jgi:hypothetical protein
MGFLTHGFCNWRITGGLMLALVLLAPIPAQNDAGPAANLGHPRIRVLHNDDGSIKFGLKNQVETENWSGYAVANFATAASYTAAQASWTVPLVSYVTPPPTCHTVRSFGGFHDFSRNSTTQVCSSPNVSTEYSSSWVGVGGFCEDSACDTVDNTLIQLGTEQDASQNGTTQYYAWVEAIPDNPVYVAQNYPRCNSTSCAYPVKPGDAITASLSCTSNCTPGQRQSWTLTMTDKTANWTFSTTMSYTSTLLSAEWIEEAPASQAGILPLADYGTVTFDASAPAGLTSPQSIEMVDPYGETSTPSTIASGVFATCWGNNSASIAACAP